MADQDVFMSDDDTDKNELELLRERNAVLAAEKASLEIKVRDLEPTNTYQQEGWGEEETARMELEERVKKAERKSKACKRTANEQIATIQDLREQLHRREAENEHNEQAKETEIEEILDSHLDETQWLEFALGHDSYELEAVQKERDAAVAANAAKDATILAYQAHFGPMPINGTDMSW